MKKVTAYGVQVKTKPETVMTIPAGKESRIEMTCVVIADTSFHLDSLIAQFGLHAVLDFVLHSLQSDVDGRVRCDKYDQRHAVNDHEDEQIVRDERHPSIVQIRAARCTSALDNDARPSTTLNRRMATHLERVFVPSEYGQERPDE
jgi:hypothetical protein